MKIPRYGDKKEKYDKTPSPCIKCKHDEKTWREDPCEWCCDGDEFESKEQQSEVTSDDE